MADIHGLAFHDDVAPLVHSLLDLATSLAGPEITYKLHNGKELRVAIIPPVDDRDAAGVFLMIEPLETGASVKIPKAVQAGYRQRLTQQSLDAISEAVRDSHDSVRSKLTVKQGRSRL